ncbi:PAS domain S-box protein [Malaciobacter mytili]|uniref:PAS domain S-box protein n=1 Tax=Malaciobacter mytili TaxID=603050 RepID=UPI003BAECF67
MSLSNYINLFKENKPTIIKYWLSNEKVSEILDLHRLDKKKFIQEYANAVIEYYIEVVNQTKKIGDCPIIDELLKYLKINNVTSDELFIICSGFKNALIRYSYKLEINFYEIDKEINFIFEQNFSGVLNRYSKTIKDVETALSKSLDIANKYIIMSRTDKRGIITEVTEAFCEISGYKKEELIGQAHNIVRHPDTNPLVFKELWNTILSGKIWKGEIKNRKKNGSYYWVSATIEPNFNINGEITGFVAIRQDITSKKEVEEQQNILVEQSKSAAMGEMISMIAHQWRQPLQAVSILIQKLPLMKMIEGEISDEVLNQVVDDVAVQLEYMSKTIDDFRDFFKPDKEKEEIYISKIIDKALDFLAYMLKVDTIKLTKFDLEDSLVNIHINEVVQVLINIIKNARDAMNEKIKDNNKILNIKYYKENNYAIIEIEDNAGGIPENIINRVFEPYFSTKTNKNGTGLGLYMSKTIIEQHSHGRLSVSNSNLGAVFKIELPLN